MGGDLFYWSDFLKSGQLCTGLTKGFLKTNSSILTLADQSSIDTLNTEVESLKSSVSEGKSLIASAITDKGVSTASSATFQVMSDNIRSIPISTTSGISIWVYSEGMPSDGNIIATKNGYSISATYVSTFNYFKIALPTSGYEGTWTITGTYGEFSTSDKCYVLGSTVKDYFLTVNVLPILVKGSKWRFNDTIAVPSTKIREDFGNTFDGTTELTNSAVDAYTWSTTNPTGYKSKIAYSMEINKSLSFGVVHFRWNNWEGTTSYKGSWESGDYRVFQMRDTYTVGMAFYSYIINNCERLA